jgi:hypothetical protein
MLTTIDRKLLRRLRLQPLPHDRPRKHLRRHLWTIRQIDRLTQGAIASGVSLETYAIQVLAVSAPTLDQPPNDYQSTTTQRDRWIQQRRESRQAIVTTGPALSQTVIESRNGERY